jgi:hypothetical protein
VPKLLAPPRAFPSPFRLPIFYMPAQVVRSRYAQCGGVDRVAATTVALSACRCAQNFRRNGRGNSASYPGPLRVIERPQRGLGRNPLRSDLDLVTAGCIPRRLCTWRWRRDVPERHGPAEGMPVGGRGQVPHLLAVPVDGLIMVGEGVWVVQREVHEPAPYSLLTLAQEGFPADEAARLEMSWPQLR